MVVPMNFTHAPCNLCLYLDRFSDPKSDVFRTPKSVKIDPKMRSETKMFFESLLVRSLAKFRPPCGAPWAPKGDAKIDQAPALASLGRILGLSWRAPSDTRLSLRPLGWHLAPCWPPSWAIGLHFGPPGLHLGPSGAPFGPSEAPFSSNFDPRPWT